MKVLSEFRCTRKIAALTLIAVLLFTVCSCGSVESNSAAEKYTDNTELEDKYEVDYSKTEFDSNGGNVILSDSAVPEGRKVIKNVTVSAETKEFEKALSALGSLTEELDGYIQSSDVSGNSLYSTGVSRRHASYVLRIPAKKLGAFLEKVGSLVNIVSNTSSVNDITDSYTDTEARLKSLQTEETRLLELLEKAGDLSDVIALEERLAKVRYEIESCTVKLKNYDTLVDYSTVTISVDEVIDYTSAPTVNPSFGERVSRAFGESWKNFAEEMKNLAVDFVYAIPALLSFAVFVLIVVLIIVFTIRKSRKKKQAKPHTNVQANSTPESKDKQ